MLSDGIRQTSWHGSFSSKIYSDVIGVFLFIIIVTIIPCVELASDVFLNF